MAGQRRAYSLAALATAGASGAQWLFGLAAEPPPYVLVTPVIAAAGWQWGSGPALLAVGLGALAAATSHRLPGVGAAFPPQGPLALLAFVLTGSALAFLTARFRDSRERAEASRQSLVLYIDSTADAFMAFDSCWRYTYVNRRAAEFARLTIDQMVGHTIFELFPDIRTVPFFEASEKVRRERVPVTVDSYYPRLDTWFQNDIYPVGDDSFAVFYRDVTERRRATEQREELLRSEQRARSASETANRLKDEFLATLSHELRTPLNAILGWAALLGQGRLDPVERARAVETIQNNARAQAHLIEDLLDISRIISGKMRLEIRPVQFAPIIEGALDAVRPAAKAREIDLRVTLDERITVVNGDRERLQQIAWNLLSNAIKFTTPGGCVTLTFRQVEAHAELVVSDTGIGIPAHMLQRIFDRFAQVDATSSREYHGLGLGLALVRHLVEAHGGMVWATSDGEGHGATFTVQLPLGAPTEAGEQAVADDGTAEAEDDDDRTSLRDVEILVVEDNAEGRELLVTMLTRLGAMVRAAGSVAEGLAELDRAAPHVLLSDIEMPGQNGYALIRQIRGRGDAVARLPVIAVTAYARVEDRARALRAGFDNHIAKPIYVPELVAVIAGALAARRRLESRD